MEIIVKWLKAIFRFLKDMLVLAINMSGALVVSIGAIYILLECEIYSAFINGIELEYSFYEVFGGIISFFSMTAIALFGFKWLFTKWCDTRYLWFAYVSLRMALVYENIFQVLSRYIQVLAEIIVLYSVIRLIKFIYIKLIKQKSKEIECYEEVKN